MICLFCMYCSRLSAPKSFKTHPHSLQQTEYVWNISGTSVYMDNATVWQYISTQCIQTPINQCIFTRHQIKGELTRHKYLLHIWYNCILKQNIELCLHDKMELFSCFPLCVLNTSHLMQDTGAIISVSVKLHLTEIWRHILICFSCFCVITWGLSNVTVLEQNTFRHARRTSYIFSTERELLEENQIFTHFLLYLPCLCNKASDGAGSICSLIFIRIVEQNRVNHQK